jgi:hypothetical protein
MLRFRVSIACLGLAALLAAGCSKAPPPVVEVTGVVLIDGQPLPRAKVEFIPQLKGFGADQNSSAVTDDQGRFTLMYQFGTQPGAVAGLHHVLVTEYTPPEFHRADADAQQRLGEYQKTLKNRPIPEDYGNVAKTDLKIEVKPDQKEYKLELVRKAK